MSLERQAHDGRVLPLRHVRVLVVGDQKASAEHIRRALIRWGCDARVCQTGAEALETASQYHPHVALLELDLPDVDGCEVGRCLRQQSGQDEMALVAVSGDGCDDSRRASDAGFDLHLLDPVRPDVLHSVLARAEQSAW
ncbi:MAG TPA: response regulator [Pirellulales bacterium]|nr:response regulator [Pirellulales bacterium]